jgi:hypothetical protein
LIEKLRIPEKHRAIRLQINAGQPNANAIALRMIIFRTKAEIHERLYFQRWLRNAPFVRWAIRSLHT